VPEPCSLQHHAQGHQEALTGPGPCPHCMNCWTDKDVTAALMWKSHISFLQLAFGGMLSTSKEWISRYIFSYFPWLVFLGHWARLCLE